MAEVMHWHHIIPRHAGGSNDPSNLVQLTIPDHAEAHRRLYEEHGRWQDKVAWRFLSGQITNAEADLEANRERCKGVPKSADHRRKLSEARKGKGHTAEVRARMAERMTGSRHTAESRKKIGDSQRGKPRNPDSIARTIATTKEKMGLRVEIEGQSFLSHAEAAAAMAPAWGISIEAARMRIRCRVHGRRKRSKAR